MFVHYSCLFLNFFYFSFQFFLLVRNYAQSVSGDCSELVEIVADNADNADNLNDSDLSEDVVIFEEVVFFSQKKRTNMNRNKET